MKIKDFIWFSGIWLYPIIESPVQVISMFSKDILRLNIPPPVLWCIPIPFILHHIYLNLIRYKRGHRDFSFEDAIGKKIVSEEDSLAKKQASYPTIPDYYLSDTPVNFLLGKRDNKYIFYPMTSDGVNIFTVGTPGSGKSVMIQNVLRSNILNQSSETKPFNWALIDIKGEHFKKLLGTESYKATGADLIKVIQPSNRFSYGWDVFYAVHKPNVTDTMILKAVTDISDSLVCKGGDNPYFEQNGKKILSGLLFFYIKEGVDFIPAIQKILRTPFGDLIKDVVALAEQKGYNIVLDKLKSFVGKDENESIQDVEATLKTYLDVFSYPDIIYSFYNSEYRTSPAVLSDCRTCLDLAIEESMLETYQPIFRLISIQILKYCESDFKESDERMTWIILDEAARCGKIPGIENAYATLRSRHCSIWTLFQDISQFSGLYKDQADVLLNLCEIKIFLSGAGDKKTIDYVSNMAGEYEIENISYTKSGLLNSPSDVKFSRAHRPIVTSKDLMSLRSKNEMIAFVFGNYYRFNKYMYFKDPKLKNISIQSKGD